MKRTVSLIAVSLLASLLVRPCLAAPDGAPLPAPEFSAPVSRDIPERAMRAALLGDTDALQALTDEARDFEARQGVAPSAWAADRIALLRAWTIPHGPERDALLKSLLDTDPSPAVSRRARHALRMEPVRRIRTIRRQDRLNRFALVFNTFSRTGTQILVGNIQGAVQAFVDTLFLWEPLTRLTPRNRQAADIYERSLTRIAAAGTKHRDLDRYARKIAAKRRRESARERIARGRWHLANNRPELARSAFHDAEKIDPDSAQARRLALRAAQRLSARRRNQMGTMSIAEPLPPRSEPEGRDIAGLASALCRGDSPAVVQRAAAFLKTHPESDYVDEVVYALTAVDLPSSQALTTSPEHILKKREPDTNATRRLRAFEKSVDANPEARLAYARERYRSDLWGYVLTGDRNDAASLQTYASRGLAHRVISSLGFLLPIQWVVRGVIVGFAKPVDDAAWRDAAVALIERSPDTPPERARQVAAELSDSYRESDAFEEAVRWHRIATGGPDRAFEEKMRDALAKKARKEAREEPLAQHRLVRLRQVVEGYPDTPSAEKARREIAKLEKKSPALYTVSREDLASFPDLWREQGLHLKPEWFDGDIANGELTEEGVRFYDPAGQRLRYTIREPDGDQDYIVTPKPASLAQLQDALHRWVRESRTRVAMRRELRGAGLGWSLEGSAGASGVDIYPALQPAPFEEESLPLYAPIVAPRR